jgi:hypothetical protein
MTSARADAQQRCLVVGYDRSNSSRHAIEWAVSELAPDGKLVITHACRALHAPASPMSSSHERVSLGRAMVDELLLEGEDRMHRRSPSSRFPAAPRSSDLAPTGCLAHV